MSTPNYRQSKIVVPATALPSIGGTISGSFDTPTAAGSRLIAIVGEIDNQNDSVTVTSVPAGFAEITPPGDIIRIATAHNQITGRFYEKLSSSASEPAVTFGLSSPVYPVLILMEITGAHASITTDVQASATGSLNDITIAAPGTTRADVLWVAFFITGGINAHALKVPDTTGFALDEAANSGGSSSTAKASASILHKQATAIGQVGTAEIVVAGGSNHSYVAGIIGIPGPGGGGGGGGLPGQAAAAAFGMPASGHGIVRRALTADYFGAIPDVATAQKIGSLFDIMVHNIDTNPATNAITQDKTNGLIDEIRSVNALFKAAPYKKGPQIDEGASYYPNDYYAHVCPWPSGAKISTFSASILVAQPIKPAAGQSAYVDPRGWTAHGFSEQRARDTWSVIDRYNQLKGTVSFPDLLNFAYADSMGTSSYKGTQCDPDTGAAYSSAKWYGGVRAIGDELRTRGGGRMVIANGLISGGPYYGSAQTKNLLDHVDGGLAENWLRNNMTAATAYPGETAWVADMNMVLDANTRGKMFWGIINLCNFVAGSGTCTFSAAQKEQWRRFSIASYLFSDRGWSVFEFVENTNTLKGWDEDHPYYHVNIGDPLDTPATIDNTVGGGKTAEGVYKRRGTNGVVYINPTGASVTFHHDRDYKDPAGIGSALYASGSAMTLPANSGIVLVTQAATGGNAGPPVVTITGPATAVSATSVTASATATDPDGVALVECRVNGGAWLAMTFAGSAWSRVVTLNPGSNTIDYRATDANAAPQTSTPVTRTVVVTLNSDSPVMTLISPAPPAPINVGTAVQLIQVQATDSDGISSVTMSLNGGAGAALDFNPVTGYWEKSVTLNLGSNLVAMTATDNASLGLRRTSSLAFYVILTDGGPPPPPPSPIPDPAQVRHLGQGIYTAWVLTRGGGSKVMELPWTGQLQWSRKGNDLSVATCVVEGDNALATCDDLANVHSWQHELGIYYQASKSATPTLQWIGPITSIIGDPEQQKVTIGAVDLARWYAKRMLKADHDYGVPGTDVATVMAAYHNDAIGQDPSPNIRLALVPTGSVVVVDHPAEQHVMADSAISDLVDNGLYWFMVRRTLHNSNLGRPADPVTVLLDEHFANQPLDTEDGEALENERGVRGQGGGETDVIWGSADDTASIKSFGLLAAVDQTDATTNEQATLDASLLLADSKDLHPTISGGKLNPNAPITRNLLIPGNRIHVVLSQRCRAVSGIYTLDEVKFTPSADGTEVIEVVLL